MATETSIVGDWQLTTDWGCDGSNPPGGFLITFNTDGTLVAGNSSGNWIQAGCMASWGFNGSPDLIYTANINADALVGIMCYASSVRNDSGCFYATWPPSGPPSPVVSVATSAEAGTTGLFGPGQSE